MTIDRAFANYKAVHNLGAGQKQVIKQFLGTPAAEKVLTKNFRLSQDCFSGDLLEFTSRHFDTSEQKIKDVLSDAYKLEPLRVHLCDYFSLVSFNQGDMVLMGLAIKDRESGRQAALIMSKKGSDGDLILQEYEFSSVSRILGSIDFFARPLNLQPAELIDAIPSDFRWELAVLIEKIKTSIPMELQHKFVIKITNNSSITSANFLAVDIINEATGIIEDRVFRFKRTDGGTLYFSTKLDISYERAMWCSPVLGAKITRGIGESVTTIRRLFATKGENKLSMNTKSIIGKHGLVKHNERKKIKSLTSDKSEKRLNLVSNDKYKVRGNHRYSSKTFIYKGKHMGIDFASSIGDHVHAVADGKVVFAGKAGGYGNLIIIKHGNNYETYYAHLNNFSSGIELGKDVARGEEVGYVGTTGLSTGPHLHFELRKDGGYIDPFDKDSVLELWELTKEESQQLVLQMLMLVVTAAPSSAHYSSSN